jgi:hypothetical protein
MIFLHMWKEYCKDLASLPYLAEKLLQNPERRGDLIHTF